MNRRTVLAGGAAVSAAVVGGALKIGSTSLMGLIQAHTKGIPFQVVTPAAAYRTQRDVINANRDAIERLARAHHDANVFANAHPELTAPRLADDAKEIISPAVLNLRFK